MNQTKTILHKLIKSNLIYIKAKILEIFIISQKQIIISSIKKKRIYLHIQK